jgi:hypothetical protein
MWPSKTDVRSHMTRSEKAQAVFDALTSPIVSVFDKNHKLIGQASLINDEVTLVDLQGHAKSMSVSFGEFTYAEELDAIVLPGDTLTLSFPSNFKDNIRSSEISLYIRNDQI